MLGGLYELTGRSVEVEVLGMDIDYGTHDTLPTDIYPIWNDPADLHIPTDFFDRGRVPIVLEAISRLRKRYDDEVAVISSIVGPFALSAKLFGKKAPQPTGRALEAKLSHPFAPTIQGQTRIYKVKTAGQTSTMTETVWPGRRRSAPRTTTRSPATRRASRGSARSNCSI